MAKNVVINGITYSDVSEVNIPLSSGSGTAEFHDVSDATITGGGQMLNGVTGYGAGGVKYTGSIATKTSTNMTVSGATVTAPAGYYATAASKSVASGSTSTPATTISVTPTISVGSDGKITATVSAEQSVTPSVSAGYVSAGTAGTVTVSGSETEQLTTKAAATITPGTSAQTIAAGTYLTGVQTIAGDADLKASNIKSGVTIFNVAGTLTSATVSQDATTKVLSIS